MDSVGTSSGLYEEQSGIPHKKAKIGLASCCLVFGIACIVLGIVIPIVIDNTIHEGVLDASRIDPNTMDDKAYAAWANNSDWQDFYLFNVTNLYDVLINGAKINYQEVGPIRFNRYQPKYNISWDIPNSRVTSQAFFQFDVFPEDAHYLNDTIVTVNPFYLSAAAQVMRQYIGVKSGQNPNSLNYKPIVEFPGGYVSEQLLVTGFWGSSIMPQVLPTFMVPQSPFLAKIRASSLQLYAQFMPIWVTYYSGGAFTVPEALSNWVRATPYLSAVPSWWSHFELGRPLNSAPTQLDFIASQIFNKTNPYSIANTQGLTNWQTLSTMKQTDSGYVPLVTAFSKALGINVATDLSIIGEWIVNITSALPDSNPNSLGTSYQKVCTTAFSANLNQAWQSGLAGTPTNPTTTSTLFAQQYGGENASDTSRISQYQPASWADLGALQFGTGIPVGITIPPPANQTLQTGQGYSISVLPTNPGDAPLPFTFASGAVESEPMEFTAGIAYYVKHNNLPPQVTAKFPTGASQAALWQTNPSLLYFIDSNGAPTSNIITLTIPQAKAFFSTIMADGTAFGTLIQQLGPVVAYYAATFQGALGQNATYPQAVGAASAAAAQQYAKQLNTTGNLFTKMGVTLQNYYAVWTYMYSYIGSEFTGTLAQLDPATGVGPQNSGLFTKVNVGKMIFGYKNRFGLDIPALVSGVKFSQDPNVQIQQREDDYKENRGKITVQDTGHANLDNVGNYYVVDGITSYQYWCDSEDPARTGVCGTPALQAANNWQVWGGNLSLSGVGCSLQYGPFKEDDDQRPPVTYVYVQELHRGVTLTYQGDVEEDGITLRRYGLYQSLVNMSYGPQPNTEKNVSFWKQQYAPDGMFSFQTYNGGLPVYASVPHWGQTDPKVWQGCTCDGKDCSTYYDSKVHDTHLDYHPLTGLTLNGEKKLQSQFRVTAAEYMTSQPGAPNATQGFNYYYNKLFAHTAEHYIPYYWSNVHDTMDEEDARKVRNSESDIKHGRAAKIGVRLGGLIGGCIITVLSLIALFHLCRTEKKTSFGYKD